MIRTNLATRPFYNEKAVRLWIILAAGLVAAATIFNISRVLHYSQNETALALQASHDETAAADLRATAARERATVDIKQINTESARAREANALIARRTFSWTELFNRFEATLPADVRITSVRPHIDPKDHRMQVDVNVIARSGDDISLFMEKLEATGVFQRLNPAETRVTESGDYEGAVTMKYSGPRDAQGNAGGDRETGASR
jgi:Tfp pilus assembly protein PilN